MSRKHPNPQQLKRARRLEARYLAEDLIADMLPERDILVRIEERFRVSEQVARDVYLEAWHGIQQAETSDRPQRRGQAALALQKLYRDAHRARNYSVCRAVMKEYIDLFGLRAPIKVELPDLPAVAEELRPEKDLLYYSEHGHWPEEAPRRPKAPPPKDPLERLH